MELHFFNTLTRKKEKFQPLNPKEVLIYTCGPTVYDFAHIGNFRSYVFEDLLRCSLTYFGFGIKQVMNLTDVDDKTIKGANEKHKSLEEYTKTYKDAFFKDLASLKIQNAEFYPEATAYIPNMIAIIEKLLAKGIAYIGLDKSVYFSIARFPKYGALSHLNLEELQTGASERISSDSYDKENAADFVLWKAYDPERDQGIFWESPWGKGRPGWHIECSAMALDLLGQTIDIHCGGVDNIFPHHENEIAQSESFTGKTFVRLWMHAEHLIVEGKKMSKSLKNFYTLRDLLTKGYSKPEIRLMLLQTHYRTQLNFTLDGLKAAGNTLERIGDFIRRLKQLKKESLKPDASSQKVAILVQSAKEKFQRSLADDLNISPALAALFDLIREANSFIDQDQISASDAFFLIEFLKEIDTVLKIMEELEDTEKAIPKEIELALKKRNEARAQKDFAEADRLRDFILEKGFIIEDTAKGPALKKKKD